MKKISKKMTRAPRGSIPIFSREIINEIKQEIRDHKRGVGETYSLDQVLERMKKKDKHV